MRTLLQVLIVLSLSSMTLVCRICVADTEQDRAEFARIANEIDRIQTMVRVAKKNHDPLVPYRFHYDELDTELEKIKQGVLEPLNVPTIPRRIERIAGDYF